VVNITTVETESAAVCLIIRENK